MWIQTRARARWLRLDEGERDSPGCDGRGPRHGGLEGQVLSGLQELQRRAVLLNVVCERARTVANLLPCTICQRAW